jgi:hypothetical protein
MNEDKESLVSWRPDCNSAVQRNAECLVSAALLLALGTGKEGFLAMISNGSQNLPHTTMSDKYVCVVVACGLLFGEIDSVALLLQNRFYLHIHAAQRMASNLSMRYCCVLRSALE